MTNDNVRRALQIKEILSILKSVIVDKVNGRKVDGAVGEHGNQLLTVLSLRWIYWSEYI